MKRIFLSLLLCVLITQTVSSQATREEIFNDIATTVYLYSGDSGCD